MLLMTFGLDWTAVHRGEASLDVTVDHVRAIVYRAHGHGLDRMAAAVRDLLALRPLVVEWSRDRLVVLARDGRRWRLVQIYACWRRQVPPSAAAMTFGRIVDRPDCLAFARSRNGAFLLAVFTYGRRARLSADDRAALTASASDWTAWRSQRALAMRRAVPHRPSLFEAENVHPASSGALDLWERRPLTFAPSEANPVRAFDALADLLHELQAAFVPREPPTRPPVRVWAHGTPLDPDEIGSAEWAILGVPDLVAEGLKHLMTLNDVFVAWLRLYLELVLVTRPRGWTTVRSRVHPSTDPMELVVTPEAALTEWDIQPLVACFTGGRATPLERLATLLEPPSSPIHALLSEHDCPVGLAVLSNLQLELATRHAGASSV